jgi:hypothetical protein
VFALILLVGLVNVCLGFALAMYLGHGPPGLAEAWEALNAAVPAAAEPTATPESPSSLEAAAGPEPLAAESTAAPVETEVAVSEPEPPIEASAPAETPDESMALA